MKKLENKELIKVSGGSGGLVKKAAPVQGPATPRKGLI
jgi:bacteriocin-like protein